jgi:hypothetical protein
LSLRPCGGNIGNIFLAKLKNPENKILQIKYCPEVIFKFTQRAQSSEV